MTRCTTDLRLKYNPMMFVLYVKYNGKVCLAHNFLAMETKRVKHTEDRKSFHHFIGFSTNTQI